MEERRGPRTNVKTVRLSYAELVGHDVMDDLSFAECAACRRPLRHEQTHYLEMAPPPDDGGEWARAAVYCAECVQIRKGGGR